MLVKNRRASWSFKILQKKESKSEEDTSVKYVLQIFPSLGNMPSSKISKMTFIFLITNPNLELWPEKKPCHLRLRNSKRRKPFKLAGVYLNLS